MGRLDGYEFTANKLLNALERSQWRRPDPRAELKEFVAMSIVRCEDLAVKGATYIFEIAEVVPDRNVQPKQWYRLWLRYGDDAKEPV